jgi:DNA polymerase-1
MSEPGPLLLLDGYSLLFRAFYALPPMNTRAGVPTSALYGLSVLLVKLLREERPSAMALAVDAPGPSTRREVYAAYKVGRAPAPDPLREQIVRLPELALALSMPVHGVPGWEADDVLATLVSAGRREDKRVIVVSGDTDLLQLADERTTVLFVGRRQKEHVRYDGAAVQQRYGILPSQLPTYKALVGDPTDNLPGVLGIGPRTATRLVSEHGDGAGILAARERCTPAVREALTAGADALLRWEALGRLRTDLPLQEPLWGAPSSYDALKAWFEQLEFRSLLKRLPA